MYGFKCNKEFSGMLMESEWNEWGKKILMDIPLTGGDGYLIDTLTTSQMEGLAGECTRIERL